MKQVSKLELLGFRRIPGSGGAAESCRAGRSARAGERRAGSKSNAGE